MEIFRVVSDISSNTVYNWLYSRISKLIGHSIKETLTRFQLLVIFTNQFPHGPVHPIGAISDVYETREYKFESKG